MPEAGFAGQKNGVLLSLAEAAGFEVFLTMDKGVLFEKNPTGRRIAIVIVRARSNRPADLLLHVPACLSILSVIQPGQIMRVGEVSDG